jgi:hypothetical protein
MPMQAHDAVDPIRPVFVELPIVVFAAIAGALIGHAIFGDVAWYRAAFVASAIGIVTAIAAVVPAVADLVGVAAGRWRALGRGHAVCNVIALLACSAASATIYTSYARFHELDDTAPLALALVGLAATITAAWLGWMMSALFERAPLRVWPGCGPVCPPPVASELVSRLPSPRRG